MPASSYKKAVPALAILAALAGAAPASAFFAYGEVSGPIDDGTRGRSEYPHSIRSNNLLYGSPVITTKNARGDAMRRVRVGGIITAIRLKGAWNGERQFKFSLWQPRPDIRQNGRLFPGISCRNLDSPQGIVTTASPDCVMQADMRKQAELPFVQPRPYASPDANRSQYNINGFGYSRILTIQGRGTGRPTIFSIVDVRASVREQDWISVAPIEPSFAQLQAWRSNAVPQPSPTWEATAGDLKMASQGGLCMHGAGRAGLGGVGDPGGEGRPGRGGVWQGGRVPPPIETGELNVGMGAGTASEVRFSPCNPTFQFQGYNSPGGYTGLYYGNCHPDNNFRYEGRQLWCHDPEIESNAMQVEYTIEPDADRDGWGDQTQGGKALAERNWLAAEADRRAREAADQAARDRWAEIARRLRTTPVGADMSGLLREASAANLFDGDFSLGGIAPGAAPGQDPAQANPALPPTTPANAAETGNGSAPGAGESPTGTPAVPGPAFTAKAPRKKTFGAGTISVKVSCATEACNFVGQGQMTSRRGGKSSQPYAMDRGPGRYLKAGRSGHVRVKMGQAQRRALRRAYKRGASLQATITIYASNAAGGISEKKLTVSIPRAR